MQTKRVLESQTRETAMMVPIIGLASINIFGGSEFFFTLNLNLGVLIRLIYSWKSSLKDLITSGLYFVNISPDSDLREII